MSIRRRPVRRLVSETTDTIGSDLMTTVTSNDGTTIAYTRIGAGPAVVLVDGHSVTARSGRTSRWPSSSRSSSPCTPMTGVAAATAATHRAVRGRAGVRGSGCAGEGGRRVRARVQDLVRRRACAGGGERRVAGGPAGGVRGAVRDRPQPAADPGRPEGPDPRAGCRRQAWRCGRGVHARGRQPHRAGGRDDAADAGLARAEAARAHAAVRPDAAGRRHRLRRPAAAAALGCRSPHRPWSSPAARARSRCRTRCGL